MDTATQTKINFAILADSLTSNDYGNFVVNTLWFLRSLINAQLSPPLWEQCTIFTA
jgi:hypothetical protein